MASTQSRTTRTMMLAVVAASALVLSACGSSSTTAAAPGTSSAAAAPTSAAMTSGAMTSGAMTSGAMTSGAMTSGASSAAPTYVAPSIAAPTTLTPAMISAAKASLADPSTLAVCTSLPYPPFEVDDGTGKIVGFDIDFMDFMAKDLGISTKIVVADFTAIKSGQAMKSKKCDIAAAAMTINAERVQAIEFSNAYYDASQALMVLSSSSVKSADDLKGKSIGAQTGTTGLSYAQANAAKYGWTVQEFKQISDEEQALQSGKIDAAIHDQPALNDYFKAQKGKVKIVQNFQTGEQYGFGAAKGNAALAAVANYAIAQSLTDGTYKSSYEKWIGGTAPGKI